MIGEYPVEAYYNSLALVEAAATQQMEKFRLILDTSSEKELHDMAGCITTFICSLIHPDDIVDVVGAYREGIMSLEAGGEFNASE